MNYDELIFSLHNVIVKINISFNFNIIHYIFQGNILLSLNSILFVKRQYY